MRWRAKGVEIATVALPTGHESTQTTHIYEHADPVIKGEANARTAPLGVKPRQIPTDRDAPRPSSKNSDHVERVTAETA